MRDRYVIPIQSAACRSPKYLRHLLLYNNISWGKVVLFEGVNVTAEKFSLAYFNILYIQDSISLEYNILIISIKVKS